MACNLQLTVLGMIEGENSGILFKGRKKERSTTLVNQPGGRGGVGGVSGLQVMLFIKNKSSANSKKTINLKYDLCWVSICHISNALHSLACYHHGLSKL